MCVVWCLVEVTKWWLLVSLAYRRKTNHDENRLRGLVWVRRSEMRWANTRVCGCLGCFGSLSSIDPSLSADVLQPTTVTYFWYAGYGVL